jgi:hypothetical protein
LHAAVFTATAVEDDEGAVDLLALQARSRSSPTSMPTTSTPALVSASITAAPDFSDTSRSALLPPYSTATRPKALTSRVEACRRRWSFRLLLLGASEQRAFHQLRGQAADITGTLADQDVAGAQQRLTSGASSAPRSM